MEEGPLQQRLLEDTVLTSEGFRKPGGSAEPLSKGHMLLSEVTSQLARQGLAAGAPPKQQRCPLTFKDAQTRGGWGRHTG